MLGGNLQRLTTDSWIGDGKIRSKGLKDGGIPDESKRFVNEVYKIQDN